MQDADYPAILAVADSLPDWFDADARGRAIPLDLRNQTVFVALADGMVVGFITTFFAEGRIHIGWLGVHPNHQRKGVGARLLACAEELGRTHGLTEIATYTLGPGANYKPYESTRQFYLKQGFRICQTSKTDNPGCPEEIKIKKQIAKTAGSAMHLPAGHHDR